MEVSGGAESVDWRWKETFGSQQQRVGAETGGGGKSPWRVSRGKSRQTGLEPRALSPEGQDQRRGDE